MTMADRIKERRTSLGMTQEELAEKLGLQKSAIAKYENGRVTNIKRTTIMSMCKILDCTPSYLLALEDNPDLEFRDVNDFSKRSKAVKINVYGKVAAGIPIEMCEDVIGYEEIPQSLATRGEYFALRICGDSMEPKISDGDVIIVRQQQTADSGDLVVATVNGTDATCKRIKIYHDGIELVSSNPAFAPMFYSKEEVEALPVCIIGKVVELRAKF